MDLNTYLSQFESGATFASRLGVKDVQISQWRNAIRQVPAEKCPDIERETGGKVTCEELRPDLAEQWAFLRGTAIESA